MSLRHVPALALLPLLAVACDGGTAAEAPPAHATSAVVVQASAPPTEDEIARLFDVWNQTLRVGGPHDMALLYAEDAILLPTVSNDVRSNREEIADYFAHFLDLHPRGVINEQHIAVLDSTTAVNSGVYTFDIIKNREPTYVVARFNFVYEKIGGKWLIKSHHSSAMPEPVLTRPESLAVKLGAPTPEDELRGPAASPETTAPAPEAAAPKPPAGADHGGGHH